MRRKIEMRRKILRCLSNISNASSKKKFSRIFSIKYLKFRKKIIQIPRYILVLHQLIAHTSPCSINELKSLENAKIKLEELSRVIL